MVFVGNTKKKAEGNNRGSPCLDIARGRTGSESIECRHGENAIDEDMGHFVKARQGG